ncbi:lipoprotein [Litchfieldia salsa]|uniref:Uncharacterized protein n=1 Tax=Litchfieldia salsa TaxID=930152 RepID=A0A1H0U5A6_9BACI|nr:lipoprotein [Litchfieldia salsa]SDP61250.1 hypothetical protein SAMN05216565_104156 [Litchfieldia salsa]
MKRMVFLALSLLLFLTGCNWNPNHEYHAQREDIDGTNLMESGTRKNSFYEEDLQDEDYNTNQNPNFIDLTEDRPDIGDDQDKFREVIELKSEFKPGAVFINGANAYVTVHTDKSYSNKDRKKEEKKLYETLQKAMPRYHIRVTIHDND